MKRTWEEKEGVIQVRHTDGVPEDMVCPHSTSLKISKLSSFFHQLGKAQTENSQNGTKISYYYEEQNARNKYVKQSYNTAQ